MFKKPQAFYISLKRAFKSLENPGLNKHCGDTTNWSSFVLKSKFLLGKCRLKSQLSNNLIIKIHLKKKKENSKKSLYSNTDKYCFVVQNQFTFKPRLSVVWTITESFFRLLVLAPKVLSVFFFCSVNYIYTTKISIECIRNELAIGNIQMVKLKLIELIYICIKTI